jgi:PAS domain S-box-containing protein
VRSRIELRYLSAGDRVARARAIGPEALKLMPLGKATDPSTENTHVDESLYGLIFQNSLDGLMLTAPDGSILDANPAACRIMGRSREEILQEGRQGLIDASDPRLATLVAERQRTAGPMGNFEHDARTAHCFRSKSHPWSFKAPPASRGRSSLFVDVTERRAAEAERGRLIQELQGALGRVKSLSGLLPMCASCRKIRDRKGLWHDLEAYIRNHTEAEFSHEICPDCRRELYPETIRP